MDTESRIAHNETLFRAVNERIEAGHAPTQLGEAVGFRCECGSLRCNKLVDVTLAAYEQVRAHPTRFVLVPGHEVPEIERVVERESAYVVVEKLGKAAQVAQQTDPRGAEPRSAGDASPT